MRGSRVLTNGTRLVVNGRSEHQSGRKHPTRLRSQRLPKPKCDEQRVRSATRGLPAQYTRLRKAAYLVSTGPELGIRQSRHMVPRDPLREAGFRQGAVVPETVALGAWPSEYHGGAGLPSEWVDIGGDRAFGISLDNLRSVDTANLFGAGRVLTGDRIVGASVRVMGTALATGHAAGIAAALSTTSTSDLATRTRGELLRQGAILSL